jgi:hypothetical protein
MQPAAPQCPCDSHCLPWFFPLQVVVDEELIADVLGPPRYSWHDPMQRVAGAGSAAGLVWTAAGGQVNTVVMDSITSLSWCTVKHPCRFIVLNGTQGRRYSVLVLLISGSTSIVSMQHPCRHHLCKRRFSMWSALPRVVAAAATQAA